MSEKISLDSSDLSGKIASDFNCLFIFFSYLFFRTKE